MVRVSIPAAMCQHIGVDLRLKVAARAAPFTMALKRSPFSSSPNYSFQCASAMRPSTARCSACICPLQFARRT